MARSITEPTPVSSTSDRAGPCRLVIGVAGGSGSGKSLFAAALVARLHPRSVVLISEDDYYRSFRDGTEFDPGRTDVDAPSARDHARLADHLHRLRQGIPIDRPVYSFRRHAPLKRVVPTAPAEVIIIEGLHVLHDADVRALLDFTIFLEVDDDVRFIRRLQRDTRQRGRSVQSVVSQYLATVKPAHDRFVAPASAVADLVLRQEAGLGDMLTLESWLTLTMAGLGT